MVTRIWIFAMLLGIFTLTLHAANATQAVVPSFEASQTLVINDLTIRDGAVSGTVVNNSPATVRGVELVLRQTWHWADERHPGTDNPGRTLPFTLAGEVAPNGRTPFSVQAPSLPERDDGQFVTTVDVTGFTEVGP